MEELYLDGNDSTLLRTIPEDISVRYLVVDYDPYLTSGSISSCFTDFQKVKYLYVLDAPSDQLLNLKDAITGTNLTTVSTKQYQQAYDFYQEPANMGQWSFD